MEERFDSEMQERINRKFERREANHLPVEVECRGETFEGTLEDISQSGVRLKCDKDLPERGTIKIRIPQYSEDGGQELLLEGVLRWTKTISEAGIELTGKTKTF